MWKLINRANSAVPISIALLLEVAAMACFFWRPDLLLLTTLLHLVGSLLSVFVLGLLPERYLSDRTRWSGALCVIGLCCFIPLLGLIGVILIYLAALYGQRDRLDRRWRITALPQYDDFAPRSQGYIPHSSGALVNILRHDKDQQRRRKAVLATRQLKVDVAVKLLRIALSDPVDEVRLLAYAMLDRRDHEIQQAINEQRAKLTTAKGVKIAVCHRAIANHYWELAYSGLATGAVLLSTLQSAIENAEAAYRADPDPGTSLLLGRILLRQYEEMDQTLQATRDQILQRAVQALQRAMDTGLASSVVTPFLAEAAFNLRRLYEIPGLLQEAGDLSTIHPALGRVQRIWLSESR